ncbi:MAG: winged helix DNA-binding protein, partial [Actinobacteria bacterium]|nr:winged helix DNA-binding protein [Actinomycetota bacterium]
MAEMHDTTEEYLETILELEEEGVLPIRARLVERLGVSAPSVSETVSRLVEAGYTELMGDRSLRLTDKGRALATTVVRRHRLAERLLVDVIGLEWEKVHKEAARWEHAISADVEEKLIILLGDPATCPHGNPIPGT